MVSRNSLRNSSKRQFGAKKRRKKSVKSIPTRKFRSSPGEGRAKKRASNKKNMSFKQVLSFAPNDPDIKNSRFVRATRFEKKKFKGTGTDQRTYVASTTITRIPGEKPREHKQLVYPKDPRYTGDLKDCPAVVVECDCKRYKYMWEYALWSRGASHIRLSNGSAPNETNPAKIPGVCKHLFRLLNAIKNRNIHIP